jgi:putative ABC transport system permease protein
MMAFSDIARLYRARLQARLVLVQELFAVLGIAVGVALLFASQVAGTSLGGSVQQLAHGIVGNMQYQLEARGPQGFDQSLVGEVRRTPGVRTAIRVLEQPANIIGPSGQAGVQLIGTEPQLAKAGGSLLRRFSYAQLASQHALALPAPVAQAIGVGPLQPATLQIGTHSSTVLIAATLQESDIGPLIHSPVVIAPVAYAQQLARASGRITRILVRTVPGEQAAAYRGLRAIANASNLNLDPADFVSKLFAVAAAPTNQGTDLFAAISGLVGLLFAFNAMLVSARLRRTLAESLRRWGATRLMTAQVLLLDALVLGLLGSVLGLALGELLSILVFHATPGYLSFAFPVGTQRIVRWQTVVLAVGVGVASACLGVLAPLQDLLIHPRRPGSPRVLGGRRSRIAGVIAGVLCLAVTTGVLLSNATSLGAALVAIVALLAALLLLLPTLFDACIALFDWLQSRAPTGATLLAAMELRAPINRTRSLAIAATGAVALFGSVAIGGAGANLQHGLSRMSWQLNHITDIWVSPAGITSTLATTPFEPSNAAKLARLPGVRSVDLYRGSFLNVGDRRVLVIAPPRAARNPIPADHIVEGDLAQATRRIRGSGWAVISQAIAREDHLRVGDAFTLPSPRPTIFRVAATGTNAGWAPGAIILNAEDYARAWGSTEPSAYNVSLLPGFPVRTAQAEIQRALGGDSGLIVQTAAQRERRWNTLASQGLAQLTEIRLLVLVTAILAMGGAMGSMIWQRRIQLAYIKRQGYKRDVLWRALLYESVLLLGSGCLLGALFGLYGQLLQSHALANVTGFPVIITLAPFVAVSSLALVSVAAIAVIALPGYLAVRVRPTLASPA